MIRQLIVITFVLCYGLTHGQSTRSLLPTKAAGKWGYIDVDKNWVISPQYDYCLPFEERDFTWVKQGEQSLLIDRLGNTQQTVPFSTIADIFGEIITFSEKNLMGWYNRRTNEIVNPQYTNLKYLAATQHFLTNDTQFYTLVDIRNKSILPLDSITDIQLDEYYFVTRKGKTGIFDTTGKLLIPQLYAHIQMYSDHFIAQDATGLKYIYTKEGNLIYSGSFTEITPIYGEYFQCVRDKKFYLLESTTGLLLDSTSGRYSFFRTGIIDISNTNGRGLYNVNLKKRIIEPSYVNIFNQNGSSYIITYDGTLFGLVDSAGNSPTDKRYLSIGPYSNNVCIVREEGWYGLIGRQAQTLLPSRYSYLYVGEDAVVKGKQDSIFFLYEFNAAGQMIDSMRFNRTGTLKLGGTVSMSIVNGATSTTQQISQYWFQDAKGKWGLRNPNGTIVVKPIYDEVQKLGNTTLVLGKIFASQTARLTRRMSILSSSTLGIVDERRFRPVIVAGIMYVDTSSLSDTTIDVMRIVIGGGYFSTVNKYTGRVLRYESKFISRYKNGHARIFIGTKIALTSKNSLNNITRLNNYLNEFSFTTSGSMVPRQSLYLSGMGHWAYIGPDGKFIAPPKEFEKRQIVDASDFSNGRAIVVNKDGKYGMINGDGNYILRPTYKHISFLPSTNDSLIKTVSNIKRYGYVAQDGKVIAPVQYSKALPFESSATWAYTDGTTCLLRNDGTQDTFHGTKHVSAFHNGYGGIAERRKLALITEDGEILSNYVYSRIGKYSEGLLPAKKKKVFGYLDEGGNWAIEPAFFKAGPFVNGVAAVQYQPMYSKRKFYGYINTNGEYLTKGKLTKAEDINENGYAIVRKGNLKGVVNSTGKLVLKPQYSKIYYGENHFTTFHNGVTTLYTSEGKKIKKIRGSRIKGGVSDGKLVVKRLRKVGAIDTMGKKVVDFVHFNLEPFENEFTLNQNRRTVHIIHQDGDTMTSIVGRAVGGFNSGYALVRNYGQYYYLNHNGQNSFNLLFERAEPFENGLARVQLNGKWGIIDSDGFYRVQPHYDFVERPTSGVSLVGLNETAGICDLNAYYIVAPRCNSVTYLPNEGVYQYSFKNEFGYIDTSGNIIWDVK